MYLFYGLLIGLIFGIPMGAVGALTIKSTLTGGIKKGILTGLGSTLVDIIYASIGVFGLTLISDFLLDYATPIQVLGSLFIIIIALLTFFSNTRDKFNENNRYIKKFATSFVVGITNPTSILTFLFAFSIFHLENIETVLEGIGLVSGIALGTGIWWIAISVLTKVISKKVKTINIVKINKAFSILLLLIGIAVFIQIWI